MRKIAYGLLFVSLIMVVAQCTLRKMEENKSSVSTTAALPELTKQQKAEGWQLLFNGQSLNGWQIFKSRENNTWEVIDGVLHCKALDETTTGVGDKRSDLMTTTQFDNFELYFEWKISVEGNSGVMFRVTENFDQPYYSGPEYQLMDDGGYPNETPDHLTGANYGMHAPVNARVKPLNEWNTTKLLVNKNHVEHWLNGTKVLEYELGSPEWIVTKNASKWKDAAGYGASATGHIVLQDHGSEIWFKNIMIKKLQ